MGIAAAGLAGTAAGLAWPVPLPPLAAATAALGALLVAALFGPARWRPGRGLLTAGLLALAAGTATLAAAMAAQPVSPADLRRVFPDGVPREPMTVIGIVTDDPVPVGKSRLDAYQFRVRLESLQLASNTPPRRIRGSLRVAWFRPAPVPPPDPAPALAAGTGGARFLARGQGHPFRQFSERRRRAALRLLEAGLEAHPETAGLLKALLLGSRLHLPPDLRQDFMTTGTFHVIAISGLHVGMIAWLLATLLRFGGLSRVWWFPVLAPLLILYTAATGASASAMRACIMALLFVAAPLIGRRPDAGSAWAAAALLIVGLDPFQIQDRGFLLSFTLVGGLLLLAPLTARSLPAFLKPDPFQVPELVPAWKRAAAAALRAAWSSAALSAAAWLTSLPLTAYFFGNVSPVALIANLAAIPASFLIVLVGGLAIVLGALWLPLAVLANTLNLGIITALLKILGWLAAIPGACVAVPRPPWWILPLWYAGLVVAAVSLRSRPKPEKPSFG